MRDHLQLAADYQAGVLAGSIPACQWVKRACERNRRDLDRQETDAFPYRFDPDSARKICQFAELLPHIKGPLAVVVGRDDQDRPIWNRIVLEPWQCWILTVLFGWRRASDGMRRFRVGLVLIPRKNAKSTIGAVIALYLFATEGSSGSAIPRRRHGTRRRSSPRSRGRWRTDRLSSGKPSVCAWVLAQLAP
jgi:phage terminase large subunit-like protein